MTEAGATLFVEVTNIKKSRETQKINLRPNFVNKFGIVRVFNVTISKSARGK